MARARLLGELVDPCLGDALKAQGFARSTLILAWPDIVGDRLAGFCAPARIDWPRRNLDDEAAPPATLVVRVESAFALELQHMTPIVMERINAHLGWRAVGRIVLKQGPLPRKAPKRQPVRTLRPAEEASLADRVAPIADDALRAAVERFGRAVIARTKS